MFTVLSLRKTGSNGDVWAGLLLDTVLLMFLLVFLGFYPGLALFGAATALTAIIR